MCMHCTDANHEAPTRGDLTTEHVIADEQDRLRHQRDDERRRAEGRPLPTVAEMGRALGGEHVVWFCEDRDCAECRAYFARERIIEESQAEREYDAGRWSA